MSTTPSIFPAPGEGAASRRGPAVERWIVAVPLHLALATGLLVGCTSSTASTDPVPVPGTVTTVSAAPSPSASATASTPSPPAVPRTPGSVTTVAPAPAQISVRAVTPPSGAFLVLEDLPVAASGTMSD